jgi:hypothetical protein
MRDRRNNPDVAGAHPGYAAFVIPGWREAPGFDVQLHIKESMTSIVSMDSGQPLSRFPE